MSAAGLSTNIYKAHSNRSASTSAANEMQIPVIFRAFASCSGILHSFLGFSTILHIFKLIPTLSQLFLQFHTGVGP